MNTLLVTKHYIPRLRSSHVARDQLLAALDANQDRKLILVAAAAGFGKTTLVADWSSQRADQVGWLSLDEGDNDPARFMSYLIGAVQTRHPHIGQELLAALQSPQPPAIDNVLPGLINRLAGIQDRLFLVLDDYHVIENQAINAALAFLLDHLPPQITLILITRTDPPLPLARLRARHDLLELRAADLRFSTSEAEHFLNSMMQLGLAPDSIQALESRTEGWIAGLQLASLAMQSLHGDSRTFIRNFTGSNRFILDYLMEEVLSRQPDNIRQFLLQTSILRRLNGSLSSAITGTTDGQAMLDYLERNNLFLIPLDQSRYWYRYHHLFADLLQARLQMEYRAIQPELFQRAAHWHEQNNLPEEAVVYALQAQDFEYAAQLIVGPAAGPAQRGEVTTLLEWYRTFPPDFVARHLRLSLQFGLAFALNGRWEEAETLLALVEQAGEVMPGEALFLAYLVASYHHDSARLDAIAAEAEAWADPDPVTKMALGLVLSAKGDFRRACLLLAEAQEAAERVGASTLALTALFHECRFQVFLGNLRRAHDLSRHALQRIEDLGNTALPMAAFAHVSLGRILIEWNDLPGAAEHLAQAIRVSELSGLLTGMISSATMMQAEVAQASGDVEGANQIAESAMALAQRYDPPSEVYWLQTYHVRLWLSQGNVAAAVACMKAAQDEKQPISLFYPLTVQRVTQARVLLAQRKTEEAVALLTRLALEPHGLLTVEALGVLALARQAQGDSVHALLTLEQALSFAERENRIRAFLDLGYPMAKLLANFCDSHPDHAYAQQVLTNFPAMVSANAGPPAVDSLSDRELEVLRLIVAGHSNDEIARALTIATSTVKWYVNTLYSKLHVKTRSQAIARAHALKLIVD